MADGRRVPIKSLMRRLDIDQYDSPAPLRSIPLTTGRAVLPLKQHAGAPAIARVEVGQSVAMGEAIAEPAPDALGAVLHAPFAATVAAVETTRIILTAL
jgi:Na+-translocating ferredoxin:NAD+ oxidoreductase RnfC subunit